MTHLYPPGYVIKTLPGEEGNFHLTESGQALGEVVEERPAVA